MGGAELIPIIVGSSGITAVLVAIITAIVNRKKLSAEATSIISEAAGGIVQRLEAENLRITGENAALRERVHQLEEKNEKRDERDRAFRVLVRRHLEYDKMLVLKLRKAGIEVDDPPPLEIPEG